MLKSYFWVKKTVQKWPFFVVFFCYGMALSKQVKNRAKNGMGFFVRARSRSENGTASFFEVSQTFRRAGKVGRHHQNRQKMGAFLG
jgi:hypothetical protein